MLSSLGRVGVLVVRSVLLTVHCQHGQEVKKKISENLFTNMESRESIEDLLREVDEELLILCWSIMKQWFHINSKRKVSHRKRSSRNT